MECSGHGHTNRQGSGAWGSKPGLVKTSFPNKAAHCPSCVEEPPNTLLWARWKLGIPGSTIFTALLFPSVLCHPVTMNLFLPLEKNSKRVSLFNAHGDYLADVRTEFEWNRSPDSIPLCNLVLLELTFGPVFLLCFRNCPSIHIPKE